MDRNCQNCNVGFAAQNEQHKYCSQRCRLDAFHKRKTGVLTAVSPIVNGFVHPTHDARSNVIYLSLDDYDDLKSQILLNQESWNQEIQAHKDTKAWLSFYQTNYETLLNEEKKLLGIIADLKIRVNNLTEQCEKVSPIVEKTLGAILTRL